MKKLIPQALRLYLRIALRNLQDLTTENHRRFPKKKRNNSHWPCQIKVEQQPREGQFYKGKIDNMQLAASRIQQVELQPNELFSFWKIVGKATKKNGFQIGRNLIAGQLSEDYGGGLCQLSGILYHTALLAGLPIEERYNHSRDIYQEHERYTPLGADATIVYGYKDLRFTNPFQSPIYFDFEISPKQVSCRLHHEKKLYPRNIEFQRKQEERGLAVLTHEIESDGKRCLIDKSIYLD